MASPQSKLQLPTEKPPRYTPEEYLQMEREADERHEYLDGEIYAMAGESPQHADIRAELTISIGGQIRGSHCRVRIKDTKVRSGPLPHHPRKIKGLFSYPDAVVICGEPTYLDEHRDVVTNPTAIFEVLSPSTEFHDRHLKFQRYDKWNPTLSDYVLVWQSAPIVEHYRRQADGSWLYRLYEGLDQQVPLENIGCTLALAELFDRVEFPPDESEEEGDLHVADETKATE